MSLSLSNDKLRVPSFDWVLGSGFERSQSSKRWRVISHQNDTHLIFSGPTSSELHSSADNASRCEALGDAECRNVSLFGMLGLLRGIQQSPHAEETTCRAKHALDGFICLHGVTGHTLLSGTQALLSTGLTLYLLLAISLPLQRVRGKYLRPSHHRSPSLRPKVKRERGPAKVRIPSM